MKDKVRVRYAPSPTGFLHIGGARSALFNFLYAKKFVGSFILRVEDTDLERNVLGGEESQLNDLIWLGIVPDESPQKPNPKYGPYRQTERLGLYHEYAKWLADHGYVYECFCSEEELQASRDAQLDRGVSAPQYNRRCLHLSEEQKEKFRREGRKPCLRLHVKDHHEIAFDDLVRGHISFNNDDIGDWVIVKSNGIPTYNFAVVIDDHLMEISHVFRGEEHLSNTPKQIQLYEYFMWEQPQFGHMTIIVNENGKKLSKRDNTVLQFMSQYRDLGYLPEAIVNFILLLGWAPPTERELYTLQEACHEFDPKRLSSSPSTFDPNKLLWMNHQYIHDLNDEQYYDFIVPFIGQIVDLKLKKKEDILLLANLFKEQIRYGKEIIDLLKPIIIPSEIIDKESLDILALETTSVVLENFIKEIEKFVAINQEVVKEAFKNVTLATGIKGKNLYMPVRLKLTGLMHGAEMVNIIHVLGKEETLRRLKS